MLYLEDESQAQFDFDKEKLANQVIEAAAEYEACPYEVEVELILTTNNMIHEVNKEQRDVDSPTDVLSFPMLEYEAPGDFSFLEEQEDKAGYFNPDTGFLMLGDIMVSTDKVKEQAEKYGHSEQREYAFLIAHSMLHLFGYDHMEEEEAAVMEQHQRAILDRLGITR